jgi:hypothetical protein
MSVSVPHAHKLDRQTLLFAGGGDDVTSGGDIGAQVPLFPVVWVSLTPRTLTR